MSIEFTCLQCGHRMSVAEDRSGERLACANCQQMLTVPVPIGGRLTEYRLTDGKAETGAPQWPPPRPEPAARVLEEPLEESETVYAGIPSDPGLGFLIEIQYPKLLGRGERPLVEDTTEKVRDAVLIHLESWPGDFQSGGLLLEVDRFDVSPDTIEVRMRLHGSLNGERFTGAGQHSFHRDDIRKPLIVRVVQVIISLFFSRAQTQVQHGTARKTVIRKLCTALDKAVGRRISLWMRLSEFVTKPMG